jgi:hypothetical protein
VGRWVGRSVIRSVSRWVGWSVGRLVGRSVGGLVGWSVGRWVGQSVGPLSSPGQQLKESVTNLLDKSPYTKCNT